MTPKEYKSRHDWVGKRIHWELCKGLTLLTKWYMHKLESALTNKTPKILWDFEIQMDHQIYTRRPKGKEFDIVRYHNRYIQITAPAKERALSGFYQPFAVFFPENKHAVSGHVVVVYLSFSLI